MQWSFLRPRLAARSSSVTDSDSPSTSCACWPTPASATASSDRVRRRGCGTATCSTAPSLIWPSLQHGESQAVIDVGSGAGLPGLALAIARPDLHLHLVEPLARRTGWLSGTVAELGLTNVTVHTARAEALWDRLHAPWVTARAVSNIVQLAEWTLPLLEPRGTLLALKGSRAGEELAQGRTALTRLGVVDASVLELGDDLLEAPTTVLAVTIGEHLDRRRFRSRPPSSAGSARRRGDRRGGTRRGPGPPGAGATIAP